MATHSIVRPAPGLLEDYAARFDSLFHSPAQRRGFRDCVAGLLSPRDRNKTLTALAGVEPIVQAQAAPVQRLQFFLSEAARQAVARQFRDGHTETWWAAERTLFSYGPQKPVRAIVATTDPSTLPAMNTWYLSTNLSGTEASLIEIVRLYGLRNWVEQSYKQMKDELGWADFMVRSDRAICRHWILVYCAFSFCWWHAAWQLPGKSDAAPHGAACAAAPPRALLAGSVGLARILLASVVPPSSATRTRSTAGRRHRRLRPQSLSSGLTNYR